MHRDEPLIIVGGIVQNREKRKEAELTKRKKKKRSTPTSEKKKQVHLCSGQYLLANV